MDWRRIWEEKGKGDVEPYDLGTLIELNGFDAGAGRLEPRQFREIAELVRTRLGLRPGFRLLEVGCGAGALLWCLRDSGAELFGVDYSSSLVAHARRAVPEATIELAEAVDLPFSADAVVCHSVFQYFPTHDYARAVLAEFARVAPEALILDVPDLATREQAELARGAAGSRPARHLYYRRDFFSGTTWTNALDGYGNAPYRFHCHERFTDP
jgi:cyclopropane fatty-acyl-phospholipid synthase-like methyltransferase